MATVSNTWYDPDGNVIKTQDDGTQEFVKTKYDGLDQPIHVYDGYDTTPEPIATSRTYPAAVNVSGDVVLEETDTQFDAAGNAVFVTDSQRFGDAPTTSAFTGPLTAADSRASYTASWFDGIGRQTGTADYGTNNGTAMTAADRPSHEPVWDWDDAHETWQDPYGTAVPALVTGTAYNARGEDYYDTDTAGIVTLTTYDDDGRTATVTQNYQGDGTLTPGTAAGQNVITQYLYATATGVSSVSQVEPNSASTSVSLGATALAGGDYLMYSANTSDTSPSTTDYVVGSGNVVCVQYNDGWKYLAGVSWQLNSSDTSLVETDTWTPFVPRPDDVLIASWDGSTVTDLTGSVVNGYPTLYHGIQYGYSSSGNLSIGYTGPVTTRDSHGVILTYTPAKFTVSGSVIPNAVAENTFYVYGPLVHDNSGVYMPTDVVRAIIYPGSTTSYSSQTGIFSDLDYVQYEYDQIGEMTSMTDQNGTIHDYFYDGVGRLLSDTASVATGNPAGLDASLTSINEITYAYKVCGKLLSVTSYHNAGTTTSPNEVAENQVLYQYNSDGNLVDEYQEHQGAVDTATSMYVGYGYDDATAVVNGITVSPTDYRPTTLQYPITGTASSRVLTYSYGASGSTDDAVNRLESIEDGYGTAASATTSGTLAAYGYLGSDTIVTEDYAQPLIGLDYTGGDDSYSGLDQFGRVQDQAWAGYGSNISAGKLDEYKYGYNAAGEVAWKQNAALDAYNLATSPASPLYLDETYIYDNLGQLTSLTRGKLDATDQILATTENFTQNWKLDDLGNWSSFGDWSSDGNPVTNFTQKRTPNAANQITGIDTTAGNAWAQAGYDAAGNMTITPLAVDPTDGLHCKYDAWNRLVNATNNDDIDISYTYDGLGRMITRTDDKAGSTSAATTDFYYAGQQMLQSDQRPPATLHDGAKRTFGAIRLVGAVRRFADRERHHGLDL